MIKFTSIILILFFSTVIYGVINQINKTSAKSKRLECQDKTITFERVFVDKPIIEAIKLFESNNYIIKSNIEYSKYMQSHLINILNKKQSDDILKSIINKSIVSNNANRKKVEIDYYIYENDKKDKGKKGKKSKLYAGYLMFEFKLENSLVYKIQTDYMDINAKDIKERMNCVISSFTSLK